MSDPKELKREEFNGNFVVGEHYETVGGVLAVFIGINHAGAIYNKYIFAMKDKIYRYSAEGIPYGEHTNFSLVRHIRPRKKIIFYVNIYPNGNHRVVQSCRETADICMSDDRIACKRLEVEYEEGEYDE